MLLVIEISEEDYKNVQTINKLKMGTSVDKAIANGTLLEQKKGKWLDDCPVMTDEGLVRRIRCSICGDGRKDFYGVSKNYCPRCGAKMEGERE